MSRPTGPARFRVQIRQAHHGRTPALLCHRVRVVKPHRTNIWRPAGWVEKIDPGRRAVRMGRAIWTRFGGGGLRRRLLPLLDTGYEEWQVVRGCWSRLVAKAT
jgi:hypothetical protein